jgi:AcrR family transcriptional regulator
MGRPTVFDVEQLGEAGLSVVSREGWSALSVRSVADELGVSPMALYRLAPDASSLRRLIADAAASSILPEPSAGSLFVLLRAWAGDAYEHLKHYPGLASFVIAEWTELPGWLDIVESLLAKASDEGFSGVAAVGTTNAVFSYVLVRAQLHDSAVAAPRRSLAPLNDDPSRYPHLRSNHSEFTVAQTNRHFAFGLDALVAGLEFKKG